VTRARTDPPVISVASDDPDVGAAVRAWLAGGRLEPPSPIALDIRVGKPDVGRDARLPFEQPGVLVRAGAPEGVVRISWEAAPAVAELPPGAATARVTLSPEAVARLDECLRTFLLAVLVYVLRRVGWHHIHAATAVDPRQRGWLIAGCSQGGKSTTAALLASCGWGVGTDDVAFLAADAERVTVMAFHAPIALRPGGRNPFRRAGGVLLPERHKVGYWPEDLGGRWVQRVDPAVSLFTSVANEAGTTQVERLGRREGLAELIRWSAWVLLEPERAREHLELLTVLARQARSYRVRLGQDLFERPDRLAELVG